MPTLNTPSLLEQCQEVVREHGGKINTALATLMLACQMSVATAQTVPTQAPVAVSAPPTAKGYGQEVILKDGSKLSFAEIAKMNPENQDRVMEEITEDEVVKFEKYIRESTKKIVNQKNSEKLNIQQAVIEGNKEKLNTQQAVIEDGKKIDQGTRAVIEDGKKIDQGTRAVIIERKEREANARIIDQRLISTLQEIGKIKSLPKISIEELQQKALKNPPKELQGIDPTKIKDGTYNNILLADYYVTHAKDISGKLSGEDAKIFQSSINNLSDTLSRTRIAEFEKLTSSLVLGSARDTINERGRSLIKEGYSQSVTWDPRDRTISFQNNRGETKVLETASIPPRERIQKNGLSISRDISTDISDPARERNDIKRNTISKLSREARDKTKETLSNKMQDGSDIVSPQVGGVIDNTLRNLNLSSPDLAQSGSKLIESSRGVIRMEILRLEKNVQDKKSNNPLDPDIGSIQGANRELSRLSEILEQIQKNTTIEKEQTNTLAQWDKSARDNLEWLVDNSFDRMGQGAQGAIDRIISLVNRDRTPANQIQLGQPLSDTSRDILTRSLVKLGGTPGVLTSGDLLPSFQNRINEALRYPPSSTKSIEGILRASPPSSIQNPTL